MPSLVSLVVVALLLCCCGCFYSVAGFSFLGQNRDRLELYALHRQAISGDAPNISNMNHSNNSQQQQQLSNWNATERAKYNAWKSKAGMDAIAAMQQYITEADRQVRVYGTSSTTDPTNQQPMNSNGVVGSELQNRNINTRSTQNSSSTSSQQQQQQQYHHSSSSSAAAAPPPVSRGLAAIPLLCAAASEQRSAYLRRLQTTSYPNAWWKRQEPLTASPYTVVAIPEHILLYIATVTESISLWVTSSDGTTTSTTTSSNSNIEGTNASTHTGWISKTNTNHTNQATTTTSHVTSNSSLSSCFLPFSVGASIQSYLWPFHNALLAVWIGLILIHMTCTTMIQCWMTILFGSRRTGHTLHSIWYDQIMFTTISIHTLIESHQPISVRLIGLLFLPYTWIIRCIRCVMHLTSPNNHYYHHHPLTTSPPGTTDPPLPSLNNNNGSGSGSSSGSSILIPCTIYSLSIGSTLGYWMIVVPWICIFIMCGISLCVLGHCFAIIEFASHL
jgi:acyl-CoA-binding protein